MPKARHFVRRAALRVSAFVVLCVVLSACGGKASAPPTATRAAPTLVALTPVAALPTMTLQSVFADGASFPGQYTCIGLNTSPPLFWGGAPAATKTVSVFMDDPDAGGTFTHWVVYNLPGSETGIPEALPASAHFDNGVQQGINGIGNTGYAGPCPPKGALHHFRFFVYALDAALTLGDGVTKQEVTNAMNGHILAIGKLTGTYRRP